MHLVPPLCILRHGGGVLFSFTPCFPRQQICERHRGAASSTIPTTPTTPTTSTSSASSTARPGGALPTRPSRHPFDMHETGGSSSSYKPPPLAARATLRGNTNGSGICGTCTFLSAQWIVHPWFSFISGSLVILLPGGGQQVARRQREKLRYVLRRPLLGRLRLALMPPTYPHEPALILILANASDCGADRTDPPADACECRNDNHGGVTIQVRVSVWLLAFGRTRSHLFFIPSPLP